MKKKVFKTIIILIGILTIITPYLNVSGLEDVGIEVLYPKATSINVIKNQFFNIILNISCIAGNCGIINVSLDPIGAPIRNCEELQNISKNLNGNYYLANDIDCID